MLPTAKTDLKSNRVSPRPGLQQTHDQQQSQINCWESPLHSIAELPSSRRHQHLNDETAEAVFHDDANDEIIYSDAAAARTRWTMLQDLPSSRRHQHPNDETAEAVFHDDAND